MSSLFSIAGGALKAIGSLRSGGAAKRAAYSSALALDQQARLTETLRAQEAADLRRRAARMQGAALAGMGASGLDISFGSPLDALDDAAAEAEYDALRLTYQGALEGQALRARASAARRDVAAARTAGYFHAAADILGGVADYPQNRAIPRGDA